MAWLFSKVTMRDDYNEAEFFINGFPQEPDDLKGWTAYHEFLDEIAEIYRTDMQGDIYCTSDGKTVTMSVERNANADTLTNPVKVVETEPARTEAPQDDPVQPSAGKDYVLNTTKEFHYRSCSSVKKMSDKNKAYHTGTRDEVIAMGYNPCGNCDP